MRESASAPPHDGGTSTTATTAAATNRSGGILDGHEALAWTITGHRAVVVRRLLERGLTARTLATVLPEWSATIDDIAHGHRPTIA